MHPPNCNLHNRLMLDLALGHLTDEAAVAAEEIRQACPRCASWWKSNLTGPVVSEMDRAIEGTFSQFTPPRHRHLSDKYPWAVAAVLALAVSFVLQPNKAANTDAEQGLEAAPLIIREAFNTDQNRDGVIDLADVTIAVRNVTVDELSDQQPLFDGDLESGDLSTWSDHSQDPVPGETS